MKSKSFLLLLTFISGAMVMVFEIIGARILAPYIGTSFFVWTALIGFVLASLSLGYSIGGKWIDKNPDIKIPAIAFLGAAASLLLVLFIKDNFLEWVLQHVRGIKASAIISTFVLFVPASIFFGMISPMISKLLLDDLPKAGKTIGNVFAFGSIGSLFGTFLAGFYLLPNFSLTYILVTLFFISIAIALIIFLMKKKWTFVGISILLVILGIFQLNKKKDQPYTYQFESEYNSIKVFPSTDYSSGDSILIMQLGRQRAGGMSLSDRPLPFNYLYYFRLAEHFNPDFKNTLMLGGAAYSFPKYFLNEYSEAKIDVVEIDEEVTRVAQEYFGLKENKNLNIIHEDARTYINTCEEKYDIIYSDTFRNAVSLPYQLTTVEAIQKQYDLLNEGGVVLVNVIQAVEGKSSLFLQAELKTFMQVFPQVYLFADRGGQKREEIQSTIILAIKSETRPAFSSSDTSIDSLLAKRVTEAIPLNQAILYDDFAPVDYLAFRGM
ncbi:MULTISPECIES: fused MFS/spermidine synthase [unclassified Lentimicrobium]|uniref:fused MFS/spermidine synthase n=1 Tax=unclassified Lentimicrobium TaxID=2677434 RepID=UPI00155360FE|nr:MULTISPECIES: fused MFS/spermidine synthase [unclassified Lentimicrobium]NPD47711.1 fused MFS/spermidine synthase [Lentimicrobium sp. S6]NPD83858.1 fused MFS/spermidine synthase [Lentimicrobium sp. L6]